MTCTCGLCGSECDKFGEVPPEERVWCDPCLLWMADVERLARDLAVKAGKDPDEIWMFPTTDPDLEYQPAWCAYIAPARKLTSLPGPETRASQTPDAAG